MADTERILAGLAATQGDTQAQAALLAGFLIESRPEPERRPLRKALDAAAVLHWFDADLLAAVIPTPVPEARTRFQWLAALPFVEPYGPAEGGARNVHESTRLGWRKRLALEDPERFRALSLHAAECFPEDRSTAGRIERVYQLLCGDPGRGADALEALNRDGD